MVERLGPQRDDDEPIEGGEAERQEIADLEDLEFREGLEEEEAVDGESADG